MTYPYSFVVESDDEYQALRWASVRWQGATVLYDLAHTPEDWDGETFPVTFSYKEHEVWEVQEAIEAEDAKVIPCLSSSLTRRIQTMLERIA